MAIHEAGKPVVTIATLTDGGTYSGFYGFVTGQPVTNLYIGYPLRAGATMPGSQGDTFSMDGIFVAITPQDVSTPEPASFGMLSLGLSFLGCRCRDCTATSFIPSARPKGSPVAHHTRT